MKVYFSHGKTSGPRGRKIQALSEIALAHGCSVHSVNYDGERNPELRTAHLLRYLLTEPHRCILVGAGLGAYVSLMASERAAVKAMFLIAPTLYTPGLARRVYQPGTHRLEIVHGWSDRVEPPEHSIMFARDVGCNLHLIAGDHGLRRSLETVSSLFERFLESTLHRQTAINSVRY